jgi:DNA helicase II / ATP-dependent DNA helicase PcrA
VRPAKRGSTSWRVETANKSFAVTLRLAKQLSKLADAPITCKANLAGKSLPFIEAKHVRPGMMMVDRDGQWQVVVSVEPAKGARKVYDLDIAHTHNYIANGVVTHNSIYAFRGARVGNMYDFERDFRVRHVVRLEQNYRSDGHILDAANALIKNNSGRLGKNLWTSEGHGEPVRVFEAPTDLDEARWLVQEVKALIGDGRRRSEIAVLYRSNAQSRAVEHALFSEGIAYRVYGGLRFFERQEVKHALAYLRLIANPDDDTAFARVVNYPARGIGARSLEQLSDAANTRDMANPAGLSLYRAVPLLQGKAGASLSGFVKLIEGLREATASLPLPEVIDHVVTHSGLKAHYTADKEGKERLDNLAELVNAAAAFSQEDEDNIAAFLAHASLEAGDNQAQEGQDAVQLMTIHAAKGLEFNAVFVSGLEEGLFPHENAILEQGGLDEERRLMYVAITRARKRLYLSFAQTRMLHGQTRYNSKSRFVNELPEGVLKWLTPKVEIRWAGDDDYVQRDSRREFAAQWRAAAPVSAPAAGPKLVSSTSGTPYRLGQSVRHAKFGDGVIVRIEGSGNEARVEVNFKQQGKKMLALAFAKLEPV